MTGDAIPKYAFNNKKSELGLEIIPLQRIKDFSEKHGYKAHQNNFYQILIITEGEGEHEVDFERISFSKNTIIPVALGQVQRFVPNESMDGYALLFTTEFLVKEELDFHYLYDYTVFMHSIAPICIESNESVEAMLKQMRDEQADGLSFDSAELLRNLLKNILILLERNKRQRVDIVCNDSLMLYTKARRYIEENISYKLHVSDICAMLNVTSKQLNAALKLYTHQSVKQYIENRVVLEAKRLLVYSSLSIKEVAYTIGFDDPTNFTKYFKSRVGQLPTDYKKQNR
ncbi:AraC family transcriptional regulator [Prolixibacteraceae bacterium JC049]|nr:AraC family transcriptional regulator [Prolixibacteraceae bacterium JC049]